MKKSAAILLLLGVAAILLAQTVKTGALGGGSGGGGGSGTVTSVGIVSTDFSVSGSPVTTSGNITLNLNTTAASAGSYGDATHVGAFTLDTKGRITAASSVAISGSGGASQFSQILDFLPVVTSTTVATITNNSLASRKLIGNKIFPFNDNATCTTPVGTVTGTDLVYAYIDKDGLRKFGGLGVEVTSCTVAGAGVPAFVTGLSTYPTNSWPIGTFTVNSSNNFTAINDDRSFNSTFVLLAGDSLIAYSFDSNGNASSAVTTGTGGVALNIASGASALGTSAIASAACATVVTPTATGVVSTDVVTASFNGDPTGVTGYVPLSTGMLAIVVYPTTDHVNFKVCNNTASSITPGAITLNWRVNR